MRVSELIKRLEKVPAESEVSVQTAERGEVCLTVTLTDVEWSRQDGLVLVGDLDDAHRPSPLVGH